MFDKSPVAPAWPEANCPREMVSYYEAVAFCRWLTAKTGTSCRLPTEREWMLALAGYTLEVFHRVTERDTSLCNNGGSQLLRTTAVGMYPADATQQGVEDMIGNVWELCQDRPTGGFLLTQRVKRGLAWNCRLDFPLRWPWMSHTAASRSNDVGFRLAQDIEP
jgi:formylglycine-generating enzyme required for sulfatase activity